MNKKFLAILVLLSVIPGCWGPRYRCNPCPEPRTTCVEATDCYQEPAQETTCYEEYPAGETECYGSEGAGDNVEYCYEADNYQDAAETDYVSNYTEEAQPDEELDFEEYDEFGE